jgi:hypothetical protein
MSQQRKNHLILKILVLGGFIASLVYFFHPGVGQFSLIINGEPVADPLIRFAAIPTLLITLLFTSILMVLAFMGIGILCSCWRSSLSLWVSLWLLPTFGLYWPLFS